VYNAQIIKRIQILNDMVKFQMLNHGIHFITMYVESSVSVIPVSKAHKHLTLCGSSK